MCVLTSRKCDIEPIVCIVLIICSLNHIKASVINSFLKYAVAEMQQTQDCLMWKSQYVLYVTLSDY